MIEMNYRNSKINRRKLISSSMAFSFAGSLSSCAEEEKEVVILRPSGVPLSEFNKDSTADEVVSGLDLSGKVAVITGCNSGLGFESMRVLAEHGAHVYGIARNLDKAIEACDKVSGNTTPFAADLSDFESIVLGSDQIKSYGRPIDILMLNAGIMALPELNLVNDIERHFVINHLGHFILANRLIDQVKMSNQGRVVTVGSQGYRWAPKSGIQFDNLDGSWGEYIPNEAYGHSKLANGLFSLELSRRLNDSKATSNSIHPGVINTNLGRHFPWYVKVLASVMGWTFMKPVEAGAATQVYVGTSPSLSNTSGFYFEDCNPVIPEKNMESLDMAKRLWEVSEELTADYLLA